MKIAILGDVHFGCKGGSEIYQMNIKQFFDNTFFSKLKELNITRVLQTGDIFDVRKTTHSQALDNSKECFFSKFDKNDIRLDLIIGNHDMFHKHSLSINTPSLVLNEYTNIVIYDKPNTIHIDGIAIDLIPWICDENESQIMKFISKSKSKYCMAHLELSGYEMSKGHFCEHGMEANIFKQYDTVWSGHFHRQSKNGNIHYVGSPSQHTWDDVNDIRGFHIFDTETLEMDFIENPYNLFERIVYDDTKPIKSIDITEKFVKVIIENCSDNKKLESYIEALWLQNPNDIKVIDNITTEDSTDYNLSVEEIDSGSFKIVPYLTEYTINSNIELTAEQKDLVSETYTRLFKMISEENL